MIYSVNMTFEHTATTIVNAKSRKEAEKIAREAQFDGHPQIIDQYDGDFGRLISVDSIYQCSINEIRNRD